jgi:hypothetical protein
MENQGSRSGWRWRWGLCPRRRHRVEVHGGLNRCVDGPRSLCSLRCPHCPDDKRLSLVIGAAGGLRKLATWNGGHSPNDTLVSNWFSIRGDKAYHQGISQPLSYFGGLVIAGYECEICRCWRWRRRSNRGVATASGEQKAANRETNQIPLHELSTERRPKGHCTPPRKHSAYFKNYTSCTTNVGCGRRVFSINRCRFSFRQPRFMQ